MNKRIEKIDPHYHCGYKSIANVKQFNSFSKKRIQGLIHPAYIRHPNLTALINKGGNN